jgi:hypothetical protein
MSEDNKTLLNIDISQLAIYLEKASQIASVPKMMAGVYLQDLIKGQDIAGQLLARAVQADIKAKAKLEESESIAYLDRASDYLKERGIKDTSEARKMYIPIDPDVKKAQDEKARTEALVTLMKNKLSVLRMSHDDLKKIIYGDQYMTGYEGM